MSRTQHNIIASSSTKIFQHRELQKILKYNGDESTKHLVLAAPTTTSLATPTSADDLHIDSIGRKTTGTRPD